MSVMYGPMQLVAIEFDNAKTKAGVKKALLSLSEKGMIRIIDISYVSRSIQDTITVIKGTELDDVERIELGAAIGALVGLGAAGDEGAEAAMELGALKYADQDFGATTEELESFAESLPKGSSAAMLLIEHVWLKDFKDAVMDAGGIMRAQTFISPDSLVELGMDLGAMADAIEEAEIMSAIDEEIE
jgi:uncharacterized membrane protein